MPETPEEAEARRKKALEAFEYSRKPIEERLKNKEQYPFYMTDREKERGPSYVWSDVTAKWEYVDRRTPEEKAHDAEQKKEHDAIAAFWNDIIRRIPKGWGSYVACGKGWSKVILQLAKDIDKVWEGFNANKWKPDEIWCPVQVKEKFGGLRFYTQLWIDIDEGDDKALIEDYKKRCKEMRVLTDQAEAKCWSICEQCGKDLATERPAEVTGSKGVRAVGGWWRTVCQSCYTEWLDAAAKDREAKIEEIMDNTERARRGIPIPKEHPDEKDNQG
jgi:hypothetical protein